MYFTVKRDYELRTHLMLQAAVLSLGVLPDGDDVHVCVASPHSRERLAVHHIGKQIQSGAAERGEHKIDGLLR